MLKTCFLSFFALLLCCSATDQWSCEPYNALVVVNGDSARVEAPNPLNLVRGLRTDAIQELIPIYTDTSPLTLDLDLRGIEALGSFAANSTTFTVVIPQVEITASFTGSTRNESLQLFKSYLTDSANNNGRFLRAHARFTGIDPIAGNPSSLLAAMGQADYLLGRLTPNAGCSDCWSAQPLTHLFQGGLTLKRSFVQHACHSSLIGLPLRYSYSPDYNVSLVFDAPIALIKIGGSYSLHGSLGTGLRLPMPYLKHWSLTSVLRLGAAGSIDLATAGCFFSTGVLSNIDIPWSAFVISLTNYAAYTVSTPLHLGGVNFDYHLQNFVFKNGIAVTSCSGWHLWDRDIDYCLTFVDTVFAKDKLYIEHYDEVGINLLIKHFNPCLTYDYFSLGFAFQFGEKKFKGYSINLLYQF